jgi:ribosomal protein S26
MPQYCDIFAQIIKPRSQRNRLPGNGSVNTFQHATMEAVFSLDKILQHVARQQKARQCPGWIVVSGKPNRDVSTIQAVFCAWSVPKIYKRQRRSCAVTRRWETVRAAKRMRIQRHTAVVKLDQEIRGRELSLENWAEEDFRVSWSDRSSIEIRCQETTSGNWES